MISRKAALFRLYPSAEQAAQMARIAGACRFVYNLALEQRRDWYRPGRKFSFASQCREVTALRAEVDWLKVVPVHTLQQALRDLDRAYQNWWAGIAGAPKPRRKGVNDSFRFPDPVSLIVERTGKSSGRIKLPKLGWVKLRGWRLLPGDICNVTISRRAGRWFAAVQCARQMDAPVASRLPAVGIDMGIEVFAALSDGTRIAEHGHCTPWALPRIRRALDQREEWDRRCRAYKAMQARVDAAWAAAPDCELVRLLRRQLVGRAWRLLEDGNTECADRLLELLPDDTRMALLHYEFETEEWYPAALLTGTEPVLFFGGRR